MKVNPDGTFVVEPGEIIEWPRQGRRPLEDQHAWLCNMDPPPTKQEPTFAELQAAMKKAHPLMTIHDGKIMVAEGMTVTQLAPPYLESLKSMIAGMDKADQQALYEFMHDALDLRIR